MAQSRRTSISQRGAALGGEFYDAIPVLGVAHDTADRSALLAGEEIRVDAIGGDHEFFDQLARADRYWPNRDLHQTGALVAAGSDWPVIGLPDPWFGLEGMVTRRNPKGGYPGALWPEQALDLNTAIEVYTRNPAIAMGLGHLTGTLEIGKSADLVVLDQNLFEVPPERLSHTKVLSTFFEGRLVHQRA